MSVEKTKRARVNRAITAPQVLLIDADGKQVGEVRLREALMQAEEVGLDLVEIAPQAQPPVCRIMDYGKHLFEQSKRHKKKAKQIHIKEIKLRPVTEIGDYNVKLRKAIAFLEQGDKVKFTVRFRGREMTHRELGADMLDRIEQDLQEYGVVEQRARLEGRQMAMVVVPKRNK